MSASKNDFIKDFNKNSNKKIYGDGENSRITFDFLNKSGGYIHSNTSHFYRDYSSLESTTERYIEKMEEIIGKDYEEGISYCRSKRNGVNGKLLDFLYNSSDWNEILNQVQSSLNSIRFFGTVKFGGTTTENNQKIINNLNEVLNFLSGSNLTDNLDETSLKRFSEDQKKFIYFINQLQENVSEDTEGIKGKITGFVPKKDGTLENVSMSQIAGYLTEPALSLLTEQFKKQLPKALEKSFIKEQKIDVVFKNGKVIKLNEPEFFKNIDIISLGIPLQVKNNKNDILHTKLSRRTDYDLENKEEYINTILFLEYAFNNRNALNKYSSNKEGKVILSNMDNLLARLNLILFKKALLQVILSGKRNEFNKNPNDSSNWSVATVQMGLPLGEIPTIDGNNGGTKKSYLYWNDILLENANQDKNSFSGSTINGFKNLKTLIDDKARTYDKGELTGIYSRKIRLSNEILKGNVSGDFYENAVSLGRITMSPAITVNKKNKKQKSSGYVFPWSFTDKSKYAFLTRIFEFDIPINNVYK